MTNLKVSAIIPTVGRDELRRALRSVLAQSIPVEIIVVLDRLEAAEMVKAIVLEAGGRLVCTAGGQGGGRARNVGVEAATARYVAFLDDDDWWEPEKLSRQLALLEGADATVATTFSYFHDERGSRRVVPGRLPKAGETLATYLMTRPTPYFGRTCLQSSSLLLTREDASRVPWDAGLPKHQDWDFLIRLCENDPGAVAWVHEPLTHVVQGSPASVSRRRTWQTSLEWAMQSRGRTSKRALADFVWSQVVRGALTDRNFRGAGRALRTSGLVPPHAAAAAIGLSGLVTRR